jgi:hypothetical protein
MDLKKILAGTSVAIFFTIAFTSDSQHFSTFAQTARPAETKAPPEVNKCKLKHRRVNTAS